MFTYVKHILLTILLNLSMLFCVAQNHDIRAAIDKQRQTVGADDNDAFKSGREFVRQDSNYYVGWMYMGIYKYNHSADLQGYKQAIPTLENALSKINNEYGFSLKEMFQSPMMYSQNAIVFQDFITICNALSDCYNNAELPQKTFDLCNFYDQFNFAKDLFGSCTRRAWLYHRYRTETSKDFPFLDNSIADNEKKANDWCNIALQRIEENKPQMDAWFGPEQSIPDQLMVMHYLALLKTYAKEYDEAENIYQKLEQAGAVSWNNYGGLKMEEGEFSTALQYFRKDAEADHDKILQEPVIYIPELLINAGQTRQAIQLAQTTIQNNGSMPGFGWYNISLGRSYLYNGQLDSARVAFQKAESFKEVHIGTTLTQQQYNFTIKILQFEMWQNKILELKFLHRNWWYSPRLLWHWFVLSVHKWITEFIVINSLAHNPDRERTFFDLFCSESTHSFDEAFVVLNAFNGHFFSGEYQKFTQTDTRENIKKYFQLFEANFKWNSGDKAEARKIVESLLKAQEDNDPMEKLFLARLYQLAIKVYEDYDNENNVAFYQSQLILTYPQIIPFLGEKMKAQLQINGANSKETAQLNKELHRSNIQWESKQDLPIFQFTIQQDNQNKVVHASILVHGKLVIQKLITSESGKIDGEMILKNLFQQGA